ncbi:putative late blight resistance protein homolog R1B-8 isoform X2 [Andrographis paniculata]|uniref:putative late blight resistance protein homolog R1B-8 isoform X2 n=1 Tax=Andrographis paniculata TaxID=175694 RepID=UPI0021E82871|nr:putative late blight resistance protein homolog R1B-8 isoform X2 [Andrographis paniculata]
MNPCSKSSLLLGWGGIVFAQEDCPFPELEKYGRKIVESCTGLPLEIIVIGGLLSRSDMSREYWESVAENVSSFGNSGYNEHCLKILSLSYNNLPLHLKPCFLFVGSYPEDRKIVVTELIHRWIANGLLKTVGEKSLEDIAMEVIKDLIARNLIFIHKLTTSGEVDMCGIHDLLRDLCLKEFDKEGFFQSPKVQDAKYVGREVCFLCDGEPSYEGAIHLPGFALVYPSLSSLINPPAICGACRKMYSHVTRSWLVGIMNGDYDLLPFVHPTQARYVSVHYIFNVKSVLPTLQLLWNLQTLKIVVVLTSYPIVLPAEIWEMPQLRHFEITSLPATLSDPVATGVKGEEFVVLEQLQTFSGIENFKCTKDVLDRIPNIRRLEITHGSKIESPEHSLGNLIQLQKLESLNVKFARDNIAFPSSLKKLSLKSCMFRIPWSGMSVIGSLPNLEKLELWGATEGSEWNPVEGEFLRLKELIIGTCELVRWGADQSHFPVLEQLELQYLKSLEEIPSGIGDIPTLRTIKLFYCSRSLVNSANLVWQEQQSVDNETLEILVGDFWSSWLTISDYLSREISDNESDDDDEDEEIEHEDESE